MQTSETAMDGSKVTEPRLFKASIAAQLYRVQGHYPLAAGSMSLNNLAHPVMKTGEDGKYTSQLSACVTAVQPVQAGVYLLVCSTFNPQQLGAFALAVYSNAPIDVRKYQ